VSDDHDFCVRYQVQYQTTDSKPGDWIVLSRPNHDARFRSEADDGMHEITDLDEATDTAQALVKGYAHPHERHQYYWRPIVAARIVARVYAGTVSAVYGTPVTDVPRETSAPE
jgi:hypothetical protein